MSELGTQLREYFDATAPPVNLDEIRTDEVWLPSEQPPIRRRRKPSWAFGLAIAVLFVVVTAGLILLVPETDTSDVVDQPVPEEPVDETGLIEPAGSGPALVWDEVDLPMDSGRLGWLVADDHSYYISMTDSFEVTTDWSWFVSDDARTWTQIPSYKELLGAGPPALDLEPDIAWDGKLIAVDFPTVNTVDTTSGRASTFDLYVDALAIDDPCIQSLDVGSVESKEAACKGHTSHFTAGPVGVLIVAEAAGHAVGWISTDGVSWAPLPLNEPLTAAGDVGIAAVEDGFILIRSRGGTCEAWFTPDGFGWQQVGIIASDTCPTEALISWRSQAIGVVDTFWFPPPSVQPGAFRLISSSGISEMESEPMPPVEGFGQIAAGEAGIAVLYGTEVSGSSVDVIEYSQDGRLWSRRTLPDFRGRQVVVGSEEVVVYGSFGLDGLLVGKP